MSMYDDVLDAALHGADNGWQLTHIHEGHTRVYKATYQETALAVKCYPPDGLERARREFGALLSLRDFGLNLAPEALAFHQAAPYPALVMTWLEGQPLSAPPPLEDETMWHRMMAALGAASKMKMPHFSDQIPLGGLAYQAPADMMDALERAIASLPDESPIIKEGSAKPRLEAIAAAIREQVVPQWPTPAPVGLCRNDYDLHNLIFDGYHLLAVDWEHADWGDVAADIGLWSAHPAFEDLPLNHWVWLRWEFARLQTDSDLVPRATIYARIGAAVWAARLAATSEADPENSRLAKQTERYLKRAEKIFGLR